MSLYLRVVDKIGMIEFDQENAKVNLLTADNLNKLDMILDQIQQRNDLVAVVIKSLKKDVFIAGADIKEIEGIREVKDGEAKSQAGQRILNKIEDLKVPTIALIDGVALGGGCELALACRYRLATFNDKVKIGLPEVNLGFVPGFGGTYRLPKLLGLTRAMPMILSGKVIGHLEAQKIGLVDRLLSPANLDEAIKAFAREVLEKPRDLVIRPRKNDLRANFLEKTGIGRAIFFKEARQSVLKMTKGFYPAPLKAIDVVQSTIDLNRNQALFIESKSFAELAVTSISKNLVRVFYLTEKFKKWLPPGTENIKPKSIKKCAVLGAGIMGGGIAQILSYKGIWARIKDVNAESIGKGYKAAAKVYQELVKKRKLKKHDVDNKMAMITSTLDYSGFKTVDCVIEAVVENMEVKKKVFKELSQEVGPDAILCTNTSALSVTEMAKETKDPSKVVGFHFFNPVHRMPLVEIIKTNQVSPQTLTTAFGLARRLDKTPILVEDKAGFLVNRILLSYMNEAGRLFEEGGTIEEIDRIMTDFGMPMGPFTLSDEVGLDVGIKVLHILEESFGHRFKPVETFEMIAAEKLFGKKSGKGFYIYGKTKVVNLQIDKLKPKMPQQKFDTQVALKRMIYVMVNEAARCLEEKIVDGVDSVDLAMILGTGFPPFRGGLLRYAQSIGIDAILHDLKWLEVKCQSDRFKPCEYLWTLKAAAESASKKSA